MKLRNRDLADTRCLTFSMGHCFITITTVGTNETSCGFLCVFKASPAKCHVNVRLCDPFGDCSIAVLPAKNL